LQRSSRSPEAFRAVYDRHAEQVHAFFLRRTDSAAAAFELTAETFAQAWLARGRFVDQMGGSAAPWLFGIARNVLASSVRQRRLEREARERLGLALRPEAVEPPVDGAWLEGLDADLAAALGELPAAERRAVQLRVLDERGYDELAAELGCTPGAARVRVFRGLERMRRNLTAAIPGGDE
jgi:RNA polymerase sigma-70 factor (ECF subfamily)